MNLKVKRLPENGWKCHEGIERLNIIGNKAMETLIGKINLEKCV